MTTEMKIRHLVMYNELKCRSDREVDDIMNMAFNLGISVCADKVRGGWKVTLS